MLWPAIQSRTVVRANFLLEHHTIDEKVILAYPFLTFLNDMVQCAKTLLA
jgi:hypothetical protein